MTPRGSAGWVCVALLAATLAAYWEVPRLGFVDFDDFGYVVENPQVQGGLTLEGARWAWTTAHLGYWAPLLWLSYMLDVELYGPGAAGHHLTNLLLHVANVLLLFAILWRSTRSLWASACVALVFAVHPLNVESVAWVTERKNVLSTLFWLLATACYVSYRERGSRSAYALVATFILLGLMVKATLVTLPIVLLLMDVWPLKAARTARGLLPLAIEKLPLLLLSAAASGFTYLAQQEVGSRQWDRPALPRAARRERHRVLCPLPRDVALAEPPGRALSLPQLARCGYVERSSGRRRGRSLGRSDRARAS